MKKNKNLSRKEINKEKLNKEKRNRIIKLKNSKKKKEENINRLKRNVEKLKKRKFKNQYKKENIKVVEKVSELSRKKRMKAYILISSILFFLFIIRIGWIQFADGKRLNSMAYDQQTSDRMINPKRGTIYDASGKVILAVSSTVNSITVNPVNIPKNDKEKVSKALATIFNLDYEKVLKKVKKRSSIENIIKKVDKNKADELRIWMSENNIKSGINIDEDTKRYYPYNNLASQVIRILWK